MKRGIFGKLMSTCFVAFVLIAAVLMSGCDESGGYSSEPLYSDEISTVYIKMFDNKSFERGVEYDLTDALAKRIEAETPYKIVSSVDRADSVISGYIVNANRSVLTTERETGRPLEKEILLTARFDWKNLKTGQYLVEGQEAVASASWSEWQNQGIAYSSALAANKLAERIVELMETSW